MDSLGLDVALLRPDIGKRHMTVVMLMFPFLVMFLCAVVYGAALLGMYLDTIW